MFQQTISFAILELLILQQDLSVMSVQPDCAWVTDFDNENSLFFKVPQKVAVFHLFWAESAKKSLRWHWGYLWLVNAHHCHVNAVGRLWWSSKRDYIWAGSALNSHFVFRRHKEVWGLPNANPRNQRWKSGPISAATLQDKYVKHTRLQDVRLRNCMHLQSSALKRVMIFAAMSRTAEILMNSRKVSVTFPSTCHYCWKTSKTVNHADFQCQCEFFLRLVMCHLLIEAVKSWLFHTDSSAHRWLTGCHFLLSQKIQFGPGLKCQKAAAVQFPKFQYYTFRTKHSNPP